MDPERQGRDEETKLESTVRLTPKGCKPDEVLGGSASPSPYTSYQPSPRASYNPSPTSSSFPSSASSSHITLGNYIGGAEGNSLLPWLKNLPSCSSSKFPQSHHLHFHGGSISAPVTPPSSSPTRTSRIVQPIWAATDYSSLPNSTPPSPGCQIAPDPAWLAGFQISSAGPSSPTFSLVSSNPFSLFKQATIGQSGTCSPVGGGSAAGIADVQMMGSAADEFAFGSSSNGTANRMMGMVKAWEGERIHEECGSDELELTLGSSRTRANA